jgi:branched-subunit amino acid transport protein
LTFVERASARHPDQPGLVSLVASFSALYAGLIILVQVWNWLPSDDDWAYVLTSRHLLTTGTYRLNDWATASVIPQVWLGAAIAALLGDHFLVYVAVGLMLHVLGGIVMYPLARDLGLSRTVSFVCAASLLLCPLMIRGAFSFMSDVPFTSFLVPAFFFYKRGWVRQQLRWTFGGSLCAAAAILTRQFGVLILVGLAISWLIERRTAASSTRRPGFSAYLATAFVVPLAAVWYQLMLSQTSPSWAQLYSIARLNTHLLGSWQALLIDVMWRLVVISQYVALFLSPLLLALLYTYAAGMVRAGRARSAMPAELIVAGMVTAAVTWIQYTFGKEPLLQPAIPGLFAVLTELDVSLRVLLTLATWVGGTLVLASVIGHYGRRGVRSASVFNGTGVIEWTTLGLLGFHLFFFQIFDEYLIDLLPWATVFLAWCCRETIERFPRRILAGLAILAVLSGLWVRGAIEQTKARWSAGDYLVNHGVPLDKIGNHWSWKSYHGEFDRFLVEVDHRMLPSLDLYFAHLRRLDTERHEYFVAESSEAVPVHGKVPIDSQPLATFPYTDVLLRPRSVSIWKASR